MAAQPKPQLSVVPNRQTGELQEVTLEALALELQHTRDELNELLKKFKGQSLELAALRRDKQAEAEADPLWPIALRLFIYHGKVFGHERCEWTPERFEMVRKRKGRCTPEQWLERCLRAMAGLKTDAWRMGKRLTMWEDLFESTKKFERCIDKCPANWSPPAGVAGLL